MKKLLLLISLLTSQASASGWEYASFLYGYGDGNMWQAPGQSFYSMKTEEVYAQMGCGSIKTSTAMLNCAGAKNWELVAIEKEKGSGSIDMVTYIFKRPKK